MSWWGSSWWTSGSSGSAANWAPGADSRAPAASCSKGADSSRWGGRREGGSTDAGVGAGDGARGEAPAASRGGAGDGARGEAPAASRGSEVIFTREDAAELRAAGRQMGQKKAHDCLNECRARFEEEDGDNWDPSDVFDWRAYLAGHQNCDDLIGDGVCDFLFCYLRAPDANTGQSRSDFVVRRVSGGDVRLHPQQQKNRVTGLREAIPVHGDLMAWLNRPVGMSQRAGGPNLPLQGEVFPDDLGRLTRRSTEPYERISAGDCAAHGRRRALVFLQEHATWWNRQPTPKPSFDLDLTTGNHTVFFN